MTIEEVKRTVERFGRPSKWESDWLIEEHDRLTAALDDIINPLARLQRKAEEEGSVINGYAAVLCKDAAFLQHIAKTAREAK